MISVGEWCIEANLAVQKQKPFMQKLYMQLMVGRNNQSLKGAVVVALCQNEAKEN